jgi:4-hydroxy-tetrahydrodipicolinate synthase
MREIGRILIPMVTPFKPNGDVDFEKAYRYAKWLVKTGRGDSIIVTGTTGEFHSLTFEERVQMFEVVWDAVGKRTPIIAATGCVSTRETVRLTREAERIGVDMVMVVSPYYCRPHQDGLYEHYRTVARATSLPLLLYNIPLFSGVNIEPGTLKRLVRISNIVAIKEESALNPLQTTRYLMSVPPKFRVFVGDDTMIFPVLAQGGAGAVTGGAQVCGRDLGKLINAILSGDIATARALHRKTFPFFEALGQNGRLNPIPILREAIKLAGFDVGKPRSPLHPATPAEIRVLRKVMRERGYLAKGR